MLPCPPYCANRSGAPARRLAPGGGPQISMRDVVSSCNSGGWLVDSNGPSARLHEIHLEGSCGVLRNTGVVAPPSLAAASLPMDVLHITQIRQPSLLVNVGASNSPNGRNLSANEPSVFYDAPGTLIVQGGSYGGDIVLGTNASAWSVGVHVCAIWLRLYSTTRHARCNSA